MGAVELTIKRRATEQNIILSFIISPFTFYIIDLSRNLINQYLILGWFFVKLLRFLLAPLLFSKSQSEAYPIRRSQGWATKRIPILFFDFPSLSQHLANRHRCNRMKALCQADQFIQKQYGNREIAYRVNFHTATKGYFIPAIKRLQQLQVSMIASLFSIEWRIASVIRCNHGQFMCNDRCNNFDLMASRSSWYCRLQKTSHINSLCK